jgi:hypothetical protein
MLQEPLVRRATATPEEVAARQGRLPITTRHTQEDRLIGAVPRSTLRHRPISNIYVIPFTDGTAMRVTEHELGTLPQNYQRAAQLLTPHQAAPRSQRQPQPLVPQHDDTVFELPPAGTAAGETEDIPKQRRRRLPRLHGLFWLGVVLLVMIAGWVAFTTIAHWWLVTRDDWQYGRPRTFQIDANVGHGTGSTPTSHFIAMNLSGHIEVIEIPGGDARKSKIYVGPTLIGDGQDVMPVTLTFADVNNDGLPDMVLHIGDGRYLFLNHRDGTFQAAPNQ